MGPDGSVVKGPRVIGNAAKMRRKSKWQFGSCPGDPTAVDKLVSGAMPYAEQYAVEFGFVRRLSRGRPRASFFAKEFLCARSDPACLLRHAFSSSLAPHRLAVELYCLLQGRLDWGTRPARCAAVTGTCTSTSLGPAHRSSCSSKASEPRCGPQVVTVL